MSRTEAVPPVTDPGTPAAAVTRPARFDGVSVFSASNPSRRAQIGDDVSDWVETHPDLEIVEVVVKQSSDATHHCLSIVVFYRTRLE